MLDNDIPVDRVPNYSNVTKNGFVNGCDTSDVDIWLILDLFKLMGNPGLVALSEGSGQ